MINKNKQIKKQKKIAFKIIEFKLIVLLLLKWFQLLKTIHSKNKRKILCIEL